MPADPVVDSHLHIWLDERDSYPRAEAPYPASPDLLLEYMDEAGVDHAVIVLPMYYHYDNRVLADTLERYPGRFAGVGVVDPRGRAAADRLTALCQETGIRGVRLRANLEEAWFGAPETAPLWRRAAQLGVPICVLGRPQHLPTLLAMVEQFPETRVVVDHFLHVPAADGVEGASFRAFIALAQFPNVFVKLSGVHNWGGGRYPYPLAQPLLKAAVAAFGAERMMWGSDWPHILFGGGYIRCLNFVRRELPWLSAAQRTSILGGTALHLWQFPATATAVATPLEGHRHGPR
jgi:L-fuconolactonase